MRLGVQAVGGGILRWRRPRPRLPPRGIRNGGLRLVLVALATVAALVDEPPRPGAGRPPAGHLPASDAPDRHHRAPAGRVGDRGGSDQGGRTGPPVTVPAVNAAPAASVRVLPASVGVRPPALLGRDLPEVRVATPEVAVETPAGPTVRSGVSTKSG
jgi:hypothetical protein